MRYRAGAYALTPRAHPRNLAQPSAGFNRQAQDQTGERGAMNFFMRWSIAAVFSALTVMPMAAVEAADPVAQALTATVEANRQARNSQQRINALDDQTQQMLERYRSATWQAQQLSVYADQLDELARGQEAERESLSRQLVEIDRTERELLPLMLRMVKSLDSLVAADLPFLQTERQERIAAIQRLMSDPTATNADRFKRIIEAYQIEAEYGQTLGAERAEIDGRAYDVLRVGRAALFRLSLDGGEAASWNAEKHAWEPLSGSSVGQIKRGLRMVRETLAPDLLRLPMPSRVAAAKAGAP